MTRKLKCCICGNNFYDRMTHVTLESGDVVCQTCASKAQLDRFEKISQFLTPSIVESLVDDPETIPDALIDANEELRHKEAEKAISKEIFEREHFPDGRAYSHECYVKDLEDALKEIQDAGFPIVNVSCYQPMKEGEPPHSVVLFRVPNAKPLTMSELMEE